MASITLSFHSEALERTVPLRALVPLEDAPRVPMPALYLLHGLYGSEQDWFQYTRVDAVGTRPRDWPCSAPLVKMGSM